MRDFFNSAYPYLSGTVEMLIEYYFFYRFLDRKVSLAYLLLFGFVGIIVTDLCPMGGILEFIVYIILLMMSGIVIGRIKIMAALLYAVVIIETMNLCYGIFNSVSCILNPFVFAANPKIIGMLFMGVGSVLSLILAVFCYTIIEKYLRSAGNDSRQYILMTLAPMLLILFVSEYISLNIYGNTVIIDSKGEMVLNSSPYQILLIQILGISSLFCILFSYKKIVQSFQLSRQVSLLEQEAHSLNQYVEEAKTRFEKTKSFRHDIKNHITVMKELIQNNRIEAALQYIGDMESMTSNMSFPVSTNNPVLDILLGNKLGLAKAKQISVKCSLIVPYPSKINDIDFCIVLSNALDNAISACDRMEDDAGKFIHISGKMQESFLMIEIQNSYSGKNAVKSVLFIIPQRSDDISQQTDIERVKYSRNVN